jgi:hypothetical protein
MADRLTKGQAEFLCAVANGEHRVFHRRVIEPVEKLGLVWFCGGLRLVGCNAFASTKFVLTDDGHEFVERCMANAA